MIEVANTHLFLNIQHWCLQLFYTNFGINFYLYCITGQNFRAALVGLFWIKRLKSGEAVALTGKGFKLSFPISIKFFN